ncbi:hypothetical protein LTR57_023169, partial [Friedmanniomyces endolithicus]
YCQAGYYCVDNGCCPNGSSLAECGASATVATVAPPASTASAVSAAPDSAVSSSSSTYTPTSTMSTSTPAATTPIYQLDYIHDASYLDVSDTLRRNRHGDPGRRPNARGSLVELFELFELSRYAGATDHERGQYTQ